MKFTVEKGDLFDVHWKYALAHCIFARTTRSNIDAGIAKVFRDRYPDMMKMLEKRDLKVGTSYSYACPDGRIVYNLVTKVNHYDKYIDNPKLYNQRLISSLVNTRDKMEMNDLKYLAIPKITCGIDGGNLDNVIDRIIEVFNDSDIEVKLVIL